LYVDRRGLTVDDIEGLFKELATDGIEESSNPRFTIYFLEQLNLANLVDLTVRDRKSGGSSLLYRVRYPFMGKHHGG